MKQQDHATEERLLSPLECANRVGLTRRSFYKSIWAGELECIRVGSRRIRIRESEFERWLAERTFSYGSTITGQK